MTRRQLYVFLFSALPVLYFLSLPIELGDLAIWVAQGRYSITHGEVLRHDVFSFLPTLDLIYPWGICLIYGFLDRVGGLVAVSLFHKACLLALLLLIYRSSLSRLRNPWSRRQLAVISMSFFGASAMCVDRPAMVALLPFLAAFLILNQPEPITRRQGWLLGLLTVSWVNLHGSWILLPMMLAWRIGARFLFRNQVQFLGRNPSRECVVLLGTLLAALVNPFGCRIYPYIFETALVSRARGVDEWSVPGLHSAYPSQVWGYFALVAAVYWLSDSKYCRGKRRQLLTSPYFPVLLLGFTSIRSTIFPFVALIPFVASMGFLKEGKGEANSASREMKINGFLNGGIVLASIGIAVMLLPFFKPVISPFLPVEKRPVFSASAPFEAAASIRAANRGSAAPAPIFNDWDYGSFLAYSLPNRIFIDSRNIIYSDAQFADYLNTVNAIPGWEAILDRYQIGFVILDEAKHGDLVREMERLSQKWRVIWRAGGAVVFSRSEYRHA